MKKHLTFCLEVNKKQVSVQLEMRWQLSMLVSVTCTTLKRLLLFHVSQLPKMPKRRFDVNEELVRRQTFERDEYESFYKAMRSYVAKKKNHLTDEEYLERELVRHWILFAANSGLRSGEQRQLKWLDVSIEVEGGGNVQEIKLAKILVRKETSKVRMPRTLYCRGGDYIERWSKLLTSIW